MSVAPRREAQPAAELDPEAEEFFGGLLLDLVERWFLADSATRSLLALDAEALALLRAGRRLPRNPETLFRATWLLRIDEGLRARALSPLHWLHQPHDELAGFAPLDLLRRFGPDGFRRVRACLEGAPRPEGG